MGGSKLVSADSFGLCVRMVMLIVCAVWSAIMDISLALLPWQILWKLQMRTAEKIGAGFAMSLGIL
jgi:hypothetical protein